MFALLAEDDSVGAVPSDQLGTSGIPFHDLTGDGQLEIILEASLADRGGMQNAGAVSLWSAGPVLPGTWLRTESFPLLRRRA